MTRGKKFFACFNQDLSPLQKEEIRKGLDAGLAWKAVESYASSAYNHRQMQEIRLALEHAGNGECSPALYEPSLDPDDMRKMRLRLEKGQKVRCFSLCRVLSAIGLILLLSASVLVSVMTCRAKQPYLHLTRSQITLPAGASFEPMEYVADYAASRGELILPEEVNTSSPGIKAAVYILRTPQTQVMRILNVEVIADQEK